VLPKRAKEKKGPIRSKEGEVTIFVKLGKKSLLRGGGGGVGGSVREGLKKRKRHFSPTWKKEKLHALKQLNNESPKKRGGGKGVTRGKGKARDAAP